MEMFYNIKGNVRDLDDEEIASYLEKIINCGANDLTGLIYGMGHAVYTISDPRAILLKQYAKDLAEKKGCLEDFTLMEAVERLTPDIFSKCKGNGKRICANVDLYSGLVYKMLDMPEELYTPLFAIAYCRLVCASYKEIVSVANHTSAYGYVTSQKPYVPIKDR